MIDVYCARKFLSSTVSTNRTYPTSHVREIFTGPPTTAHGYVCRKIFRHFDREAFLMNFFVSDFAIYVSIFDGRATKGTRRVS